MLSCKTTLIGCFGDFRNFEMSGNLNPHFYQSLGNQNIATIFEHKFENLGKWRSLM